MAETTGIEWCDATANLWWGCEHMHPGCDHCYAEQWAKSKGKEWGRRWEVPGVWKMLEALQRKAKREGHRRTVFVGSMMDIFERPQHLYRWGGGLTPVCTGTPRQTFFREVVPACPDLVFLLLTKRPSNIRSYVPIDWIEEWPSNVWTGTSVSDQPTADTLLAQLLRVPGRHFVSYEPALGPVDFSNLRITGDHFVDALRGVDLSQRPPLHSDRAASLDWVIAGGESGPHARPPHPDWFRSVRDQCAAAGVPFLFKQWGEYLPPEQDGARGDNQFLNCADEPSRIGKKKAGRLLDGREHLEFPAFQHCTEVA